MGTDQTLLHRFVLTQLEQAGLDRNRLIRECGVPEWTLSGDGVHVPSESFGRLWELGGQWLDDPDVALRVASRYELRATRLYDYLFVSAPTVGAGLATCGPYVTAVTTNHRFDLVDGTGGPMLTLDMVDGDGKARDHTQLWGLTAVLTRARRVVDAPLNPTVVTLRQRAPRRLDAFREVFGEARLEFGADMDALTFRPSDMELPLTTADPALAAVLRPLAEALPPPPPLSEAWPQRVAVAIAEALEAGDVSLERVAQRLATSPRTLQRRLADAGTTWRRELDRARHARLSAAVATGPLSRNRQAHLLGYADATSMRRATLRWAVATHTHRLATTDLDL
ncbi:AraC family transcriptional regulator ligand-binding domain-containing protein [Nocardia huaxiensis]|uniref:AraC family transcriptional regulator ligand-binding domain-containing protein n=1 Tax=Nocardia huaxiensis TaxID=2755382 RepID=A0A7D6ZFQ9_9NOCA|nr:AraC family transcriptional regulator ligand-binding domain-containing protein [Nocardia huaxiensis]QLY29227.1 AraC family transcriptional regulator ligand-binding domain-containing protein [Nocardia huaxiensis]UFS97272.1 AraC family transcriptional regulator ligand-binding domain-containing protein [Nocardia huaxiensis]